MDKDDVVDGKRPQSGEPLIKFCVLRENVADNFIKFSVSRELLVETCPKNLLDGHATLGRNGFDFDGYVIRNREFENLHVMKLSRTALLVNGSAPTPRIVDGG
jgi:hypothetical protein